MYETVFKHNDPDSYHDKELTLHDCIAEKIICKDGILQFDFPNGFWVTPNHEANNFEKIVRTNASQVDFRIDDINDVNIEVYTENLFGKTKVEFWNINNLIEMVNSRKCSIEFIYQYRTHFEQMWQCYLHFKKRPYLKDCYLHLPGTDAVYKWNELRPDCEW